MAGSYKGDAAISLPFAIDDYGNVRRTNDQQKIWQDRVRSVIGTLTRERVMRSNFGTRLSESVFENEPMIKDIVEREISNAFVAFLPTLRLDSVDLSFDTFLDTVTVDVVYALPNEVLLQTSVGIATISGTKLISEEKN